MNSKNYQFIKNIIQLQTEILFKQHTAQTDLLVRELSEEEKARNILAFNMALILIPSSILNIQFQFYYQAQDMRSLLSNVIGKKTFADYLIHDYCKEFCNLVGGKINSFCQAHSIDSGISLPVLASGFDALFMSKGDQNYQTDLFAVEFNTRCCYVKTIITINQKDKFENIQFSDAYLKEITDQKNNKKIDGNGNDNNFQDDEDIFL